jgi:hypothetical protein
MNHVFTAAPTHLTSSALASVTDQLRGCSRELARAGSPTARLQPVYDLIRQACRAYDKGAACFAAAASLGPLYSSAAQRKFMQKIKCGFAASGPGGQALAQAQIKASEIKAAAG